MAGVCVGVQQKLIGTDILNCGMKTNEMVGLTVKQCKKGFLTQGIHPQHWKDQNPGAQMRSPIGGRSKSRGKALKGGP